ncbi:MAG: aldo/keto reductase [Gemmatimonadales bacterium]
MLEAFDKGVNFFFFSSDLHHHFYSNMAPALRSLCGKGASSREHVVLACVTYVTNPSLVEAALLDQIGDLGLEYIDVFMWGMVPESTEVLAPLVRRASTLGGPSSDVMRFVERLVGPSERLKRYGAIRHVGMSFHSAACAYEVSQTGAVDVLMIPHNVSHRGAQRILLQGLARRPTRPGVVGFKSLVGTCGPLTARPRGVAPDVAVPTVAQLYRYTLFQDNIDVCLTGPRTRADILVSLRALQAGPLDRDEREYLERYGDVCAGRQPPATLAPR